jgi:hypothetical protein
MIRHIVLFNFKPGVSDAAKEETLRRLRAMKDVPSIRGLELNGAVATQSRHAGKRPFAYSCVMTFDDVDGFHSYTQHPLHKAFDEDWVKPNLDEDTIWSGQFEIEEVK